MVNFIGYKSVDTNILFPNNSELKSKIKNGDAKVVVIKDGSKLYSMTDISAKDSDKLQKLLSSPSKLFKSADTMTGSDFSDSLSSFGGKDIVKGKGGDDLIKGGEGADSLYGQDGKDTIFGEGGDDIINGGSGLNTLSGGAGSDRFVFDSALKSSNVSTIADFGDADYLVLSKAVFKDLHNVSGDILSAKSFFEVGVNDPQNMEDHSIIYDKSTGALSYTATGTVDDAILFCRVKANTSLSHLNFDLV